MSVWGGIGEGIAQGLSDRMAREDQRRREAQAQANADRAFQFQQEQAQRAQANADRQYEANRADAANAQANADREFAFKKGQADLAQTNADREYGLRQDELALKGIEQEWNAAIKDEQMRGFQMANEKLDLELRKRRREEEIQQNTGADQFVLATSRMMDGTLGKRGKWQFGIDDGSQQQLEGTLVEGDEFYRVFGKDSPLVKQGFYGILMQEDENGEPHFVFMNNDPNANIVKTPEQMYEMYKGQYNEGLANRYFGKTAQRKDLGMLSDQERIKADAKMRIQKQQQDAMLVNRQMDAFSRHRSYEYRLAASGEIDQDELDRRLDAIDERERRVLKRKGIAVDGEAKPTEWVGADGTRMSDDDIKAYKDAGYEWDTATGRPKKKKKRTTVGIGHYQIEKK